MKCAMFKCDRCGKSAEVSAEVNVPENWSRWIRTDTAQSKCLDLCVDCSIQVDVALEGLPDES